MPAAVCARLHSLSFAFSRSDARVEALLFEGAANLEADAGGKAPRRGRPAYLSLTRAPRIWVRRVACRMPAAAFPYTQTLTLALSRSDARRLHASI